MQYSGHFTISKQDNIDFNFLLMKRRLILSTLLVFVIIVALVTFLNYTLKYLTVVDSLLQGLLMGAVGLVIMAGVNIGSMYLRLNSMYKKKQITDFSFDVTVDKDGFHARSQRGNSDIPWARILLAQETNRAFYVFITENNANVLPKSQMHLPDDADTLRRILSKNLEPSKCRLKRA